MGGAAITRLTLRDFRGYRSAELAPGPGVTVIHGANGAGKTNLLEALYFGCTGRSFRTSSDRDMLRFGCDVARVELEVTAPDGAHTIAAAMDRGEKVFDVDGSRVQRLTDNPARPLVSVFAPDRLELIKGPPSSRRGHLDQVVTALWPTRSQARRSYGAALAQRNALLSRARAGGPESALDAWDLELARNGISLMQNRRAAADLVAAVYPDVATELGLTGVSELAYRPRSAAGDAEELAAELHERRASDLARGFTQHGPHRDDLALLRDGRELRAFGSQGEQRLALLSLLLAEREVLSRERGSAPLLLLDDVMSELDSARRSLLAERISAGGQTLITTTEQSHVPALPGSAHREVQVVDGDVVSCRDALAT